MNEGGDEGGGMAASCIGLARSHEFVDFVKSSQVKSSQVKSSQARGALKVALKVSQSISFGAAGGAIAHPIPHLILPP
jgi:hypothetical protein